MEPLNSRFSTPEGNKHLIDKVGNHFINGKCVNPKITSKKPIGSTHPPLEGRVESKVEVIK